MAELEIKLSIQDFPSVRFRPQGNVGEHADEHSLLSTAQMKNGGANLLWPICLQDVVFN
jgi:hypothetical protein